jgi:hypothetical protein
LFLFRYNLLLRRPEFDLDVDVVGNDRTRVVSIRDPILKNIN